MIYIYHKHHPLSSNSVNSKHSFAHAVRRSIRKGWPLGACNCRRKSKQSSPGCFACGISNAVC